MLKTPFPVFPEKREKNLWKNREYVMEYVKVITTFSDEEKARETADVLVKERLAACCQILGPMTSIYTWKGNIEKEKEYIVFIKTKKVLYEEVEKRIKELHTYEVPEIIAVPIVNGLNDYLKWIDENVK